MPELPEVETVLRTLETQIKDLQITDVTVRYAKTVLADPERFRMRLAGQHFRTFRRRGKYLIFGMDDILLVSHLRMEGKYYLQSPSEPLQKHTHVIFSLSDGSELRYHDTRKFGRMELMDPNTDLDHFHDLGPEPFSDAFNADYIAEWVRGKHTPAKSLLLDQHFVAGIGNIYADEILAACGIRPGRSCSRLRRKDMENIAFHTVRILDAAIAAGGTTIRSYTSSLGVTGRFFLACSVHEKETCGICGSRIRMKRIGGRSSYYCPVCQKW